MLTLPTHPRNIITLRAGPPATYTVPFGKIFVLTAVGSLSQGGVAPTGLIAPLTEVYANDVVVVRGGTLGYVSNAALNLKEFYGPMMTWSKVPPGLHFPAGTVLKVRRVITGGLPDHWTAKAAGYLVNA